jgi:hypothetical protein
VRAYVDAVVKGEQEGDAEVGRALMDVCGRIGEGEDWEKKISGQLQVSQGHSGDLLRPGRLNTSACL